MKQICCILLIILSSCTQTSKTIDIIIFTSEGTIELELYPEKAPLTVSNFTSYIEHKLYDGAKFYRTVKPDNQPNNTIKIGVIQGGLGFNETDEELPAIAHENTLQTGIQHLNGTISMARADTGTVTSEFFICINNQPELDYGGNRNPDKQGFAAFGQVSKGMDLVRQIQYFPDQEQLIIQPVTIDSIRYLK
ncbi:MAG: peptidylprolyl isomerase [Prolixibacteraceae bacterium]|jgi:peptidyl-prolyl cis-trans isomerase A (cyclophilin A)|nr:peptidylprolyl isomerase [Prolixibacteraceae bacterium]